MIQSEDFLKSGTIWLSPSLNTGTDFLVLAVGAVWDPTAGAACAKQRLGATKQASEKRVVRERFMRLSV